MSWSAIPEPVEKWQNCEGHNLLKLKYEDPERWSFLFNVNAIISRFNEYKVSLDDDQQTFFSERSLLSSEKVFMPYFRKIGKIKN